MTLTTAWAAIWLVLGVAFLFYSADAGRRERLIQRGVRERKAIKLDPNQGGQRIALYGAMVVAVVVVVLSAVTLITSAT